MKDRILTKKQTLLLKKIGQDNFIARNFYLTGGTALASFYLGHRYSEDLDFFSEKEFDVLNIDVFLESIKKDVGFFKIDYQQSYNRNMFFLHFRNEILKMEFTFFPFPRIKKGQTVYGVEIDSLLDIAVNKLFSIYQRIQARDFIDFYFICRKTGYSTRDLIKKAKIKFDWHIDCLQLGTQFIKVTEAKDFPRLVKKIADKEWQDFFIAEAKKFKKEIIE
jgi:predicted nucleotidyltransferase component of viral defense system